MRVKAATLSRSTGRLALEGTASPAFTGRVSVQVEAHVHGRWQIKTVKVAVRRGTLNTSVIVPTSWARSSSKARVTIIWPGSSRFLASTESRAVHVRRSPA